MVLIFQQSYALLCHTTGKSDMLVVVHLMVSSIGINVWLIEQSHFHLHGQYATGCLIDDSLVQPALAYSINQQGESLTAQVHLYTGIGSQQSRILQSLCHVVSLPHAVNTVKITHHKTAEVPVAVQHIAQQIAVGCTGSAVHRVVRSHHRQRASLYGTTERWQETLVQVTHAHVGGITVLSALG